MGKPIVLRSGLSWWALDTAGNWLLYDESDRKWYVEPQRPDPDSMVDAELPSDIPDPPARGKARSGRLSVDERVLGDIDDISAQASKLVGEKIEFCGAIISRSALVGVALKELGLGRLLSKRFPQHQESLMLGMSDSKVYVLSCEHEDVDSAMAHKRRPQTEILGIADSWDRDKMKVTTSATPLSYRLTFEIAGRPKPVSFDAPKGTGGMSEEMVRILQGSSG